MKGRPAQWKIDLDLWARQRLQLRSHPTGPHINALRSINAKVGAQENLPVRPKSRS
jgi:hypothetical protein